MKNQIKTIALLLFLWMSINSYSMPCYAPYLLNIKTLSCSSLLIKYSDYAGSDTAWLDVSVDSNFNTFVIYKYIFKIQDSGFRRGTFILNGLNKNIKYYFRLGNNLCGKNNYNGTLKKHNYGNYIIKQIPQSYLNNFILRDSFVSCDSFIAVWTKIPNATYTARLYRRDSTPVIVYSNIQSKSNLDSNFCTFKDLQRGKTYYWNIEVTGCLYNGNSTYLSNMKKTILGGGKPYAGIDMHNFQANAVLLNANPILFPNIGTWSVIEGDGGIITNINDPKSIFTGTIGVRYKLKWQSTFPGCDDSDTVEISLMCGYPITDTRDSQVYPTVYLKGFCWLAKNLNYGQFLNSSTNQNSGGTVFKYCYDDSIVNCNKYGGLYQWDNLMRGASMYNQVQGICPTGWHVATHIEWDSITKPIGGYKNFQLRVGGSTKFESEFGGRYIKYTGFQGKNSEVYYYNSGYWYNYMLIYNNNLYPGRYNGNVLNAFALRCVMD